ncbi:hypothetical protein OIU76_000060, partial [Salix suchowensis]
MVSFPCLASNHYFILFILQPIKEAALGNIPTIVFCDRLTNADGSPNAWHNSSRAQVGHDGSLRKQNHEEEEDAVAPVDYALTGADYMGGATDGWSNPVADGGWTNEAMVPIPAAPAAATSLTPDQ